MKIKFEGKQEEGERVSFEPLEEPWAKYRLDDGTVVRMRLIVADVVRLHKKSPTGEPVYVVKSSNILAVEEPDTAQKVD